MTNTSDGAMLAATRRGEIRSLSVVRTWRGLAKLALILAAIVASALSVAVALDDHAPWLFWPVAVLVSVWAQHAANEEVHDGAHFRLVNGHRANDLLSGFYAGLIGVPFHEYRATHLIHHRHFGMPLDPDYPKYATRPTGRAGWVRYFAVNFSGLAALQRLTGESTTPSEPRARLGQYPLGCAALQVVLWGSTALTVSPFWYPLCWLLPLVTLSYGMTQFRVLLEHWHDPTPDDTRVGSLVNLGGAVQKHLFAGQFGYNHHGTHHLLPSVPNYNLVRIDRVLADDDWMSAVTSTSYVSRAAPRRVPEDREVVNTHTEVMDSVKVAEDVARGGTFALYWQTLRTDPGKIVRGIWDTLSEIVRFVLRPRVRVPAGVFERARLVGRFIVAELRIPGGTTTLETIWFAYGAASARSEADNWVEVGLFKGLSTARLSLLCELYGHHLYAYDTFEGLPGSDAVYEPTDGGVAYHFKAGSYSGTEAEVRANVAAWGRPERVTLVKGNVTDTLREHPVPGGLHFAFLDVDLVESYKACFDGLAPAIGRGTVIMTHEACYQPIRELLEDASYWQSIGCAAPDIVYVADTFGLRSCRNLAILKW